MPQISIVLPVYNMERLIEQTVSSILSQTYSDFELICIDDGSTDKTPLLLDRLAKQDSRISVFRQDNAGPGASRNAGLDKATGSYVIMLDADDIYHPNMLEKLHSMATTHDADMVVCGSNRFDDSTGNALDSWWAMNISQVPIKDVFSWEDMPDFVFTAFMGWPWDKLYRREFIEKHSLRYPHLSNSEDLYFVFLSIAKAERIAVVEEALIEHRDNRSGSVSGSRANNPFDFYKSTCLLKEELKKYPGLFERVSWGFYNWAFEYMVWNIETMTDPRARSMQLDALKRHAFPELEIDGRSAAFYSLKPNIYERYLKILDEALGIECARDNEKKDGGLLSKLINLLQRLNDLGLAGTIAAYREGISEKLSDKSCVFAPVQTRGDGYLADAQSRVNMQKEPDHV